MPQAKLPDLNKYWQKYHDEGKSCLENFDFEGCVTSVYCMIALMPDDYRLDVSTKKYNDIRKNTDFVDCYECKETTLWNDLRIIDVQLTLIDSIVKHSSTQKVWFCRNCNYENVLDNTLLTKNTLKVLTFSEVIPEPPEIPPFLYHRSPSVRQMSDWWNLSKIQIDRQLARIRQEYGDDDEVSDEDGGEK